MLDIKVDDIIYDLYDMNNKPSNKDVNKEIKKTLISKIKKHTNYSKVKKMTIEYLGSGAYGRAYSINNVVFKLTKDIEEFKIAEKLVGLKNDHLVDIFESFLLLDDIYLIIQERLITNECLDSDLSVFFDLIDETEFSVFEILSDMDINIENIINEEDLTILNKKCFDEDIFVLKSLHKAYKEIINKTGFVNEDLHIDNIGYKQSGELATFDHSF